jgi:radical SAM superfamily enzyme YgiQ (UPF0313 family)
MKLLFINPAPYKGRKYNVLSLGLIYLISYYKKFGKYSRKVKFKIYDENCQDERTLLRILKEYNPDVIGISCTSLVIERAEELIKLIRSWNKDVLIIGGGVHFQVDPKGEIKSLDVDIAFTGEAEIPFKELIDLFIDHDGKLSEKLLSKVAGISYKSQSRVVVGPPGKIVKDLDFMSYRDFSYYDEKHYFQKKYELYPGVNGRVLIILSSRGCPFNCKFCFNSFRKRPVRFHSIDYTLKLIKYFVKKYNIKLVLVNDDLFLVSKQRVTEFCQKLISSRLNIKWTCQGRADLISDRDVGLLRLMKQAGCLQISFGFESGSERILKFIKGKTSSVEKNQRAIDLVHQSGMRVYGYFMVGLPRETKKDLMLTEAFIEKNLDKMAFYEIFVFTPLPGTFLWDLCKKEGLLENVSFADLVTNMFSMDYRNFRVFSKGVRKKDVYLTKKHLKQLIIKREPFLNKINYVLLNLFRDPQMTISKFFYYFNLRKDNE